MKACPFGSIRLNLNLSIIGLHNVFNHGQTETHSACFSCKFGFKNPRVKKEKVTDIYCDTYVMDSVYESEIAKELDSIKFQYGIQLASKYTQIFNLFLMLDAVLGIHLIFMKDAAFPMCTG